MKAQFSSCGKRSTKNQSEQLQQVAVGAMGLVCDEFGARYGRRLAAPRPLKVFQKIKIYQKKGGFLRIFYQKYGNR